MKITLCLLILNERPCLEVILPRIPQASETAGYDEIVAIDGGSTDGSIEFLEEHGILVVGQSRRGRGDAFLLAISNISSDAFVFFSPDGNEAVEDLPRFRQHLEDGADLVIASRMMKSAVNEEDSQIFKWRKWVNQAFTLIANILFRRSGSYVTDTINGYRAITLEAAQKLELDALDYTIEYQMTIRAFKKSLRVVEFPTIEGDRIAGETGAKSLPTGPRFVWRFLCELIS